MNSKYKVTKFKKDKLEYLEDLISIEEPLEISLKFKDKEKWITKSLSITMRTPGHDEDLVRGFLFNEQIIQSIKDIENIESFGDKVGQYNIQNKILVTLNNSQNVNISKIKRDFLTNSSCGVCGKSSLDALEIIKKNKTNKSNPKLSKEIMLRSEEPQSFFASSHRIARTGGGIVVLLSLFFSKKRYPTSDASHSIPSLSNMDSEVFRASSSSVILFRSC